MTRRHAAKHKLSRRMGENVWGHPRSSFNMREYPPGEHGPSRRMRKPSDFSLQLRAKQKLRGYYGDVSERQFRRVYVEAARPRGDTGQLLVGFLERRLDAVVFRARFASTPFAARQLVNHGHVELNGKRATIPSMRVKVGDVVSVRERSRDKQPVLEGLAIEWRQAPDYLDVDEAARTAKVLRTPTLEEIPYAGRMEPNLVVEFYSR